jgi:peptide/nickel transport system substrate-binding protein
VTSTTRRVMTRGLAIVASLGLVGALTACSGDTGADDSKLVLALPADAATFGYDPLEYSGDQRIFFEALYDSLAREQADGSIVPGLATEFSYNEDNTVLTIGLRDDVEFADGAALDADLVKENLDRRSNPELVAYGPIAEGGDAEVLSVDVVSDSEVALTFAAPQPGFEANLTSMMGMIVGPEGIADTASLETTPDGSGPFVLGEATNKGSLYVFEKKAEHAYADEFAYDTIEMSVITDPQARTNALISGQVDAGLLDNTTIELAESSGLGVSEIGGTVTTLLVFDRLGQISPAFGDERVRQAIGLAIDRDALVDAFHPGDTAAVNVLPADNPGWSADVDAEYGYDPERAQELLAEAGYADGFAFEVVATPDIQADFEAIQSDLAVVGIDMTVTPASSTDQMFAAVRTTPMGMLQLNWSNAPGIMFGVVLGFSNWQGASIPALQGATGAVAGAQSDADRAAALQTLNEELVKSGWLIPVYELVTRYGYDTDKLAAVEFPGASNLPLLSSFAPAE